MLWWRPRVTIAAVRVLGVGDSCDIGDLYLRLVEAGHDVRVVIGDDQSRDVLDGMVQQAELAEGIGWVGRQGLIVFEGTGRGELQDRLRQDGHRVIGGSALGDRLETDRGYGQQVLAELGLPTAASHSFDGWEDAIAFVEHTRRRMVLKFTGGGYASTRSYVGILADGRDLLGVLRLQRSLWRYDDQPQIVLMDHLAGVEVGVGAFFNGNDFMAPANLDWEHKRFFPGDLGELTGEMGTVVTFRGAERLFQATLARAAPLLRASRYVGYVNLNMIVNDAGTWPLEFTCRFGCPGFAILSALYAEPWASILDRVVDGGTSFATHEGFAVGVVLTVPPFPYPDGYERLSKGVPIFFADGVTDDDRRHLHFGEVGMQTGQLVTAGQIGYVMVATGRGDSVGQAREAALRRAGQVIVPNVRYRTDIGVALENGQLAELSRLGWL